MKCKKSEQPKNDQYCRYYPKHLFVFFSSTEVCQLIS